MKGGYEIKLKNLHDDFGNFRMINIFYLLKEIEMASITREANGRRLIQFIDIDGKHEVSVSRRFLSEWQKLSRQNLKV